MMWESPTIIFEFKIYKGFLPYVLREFVALVNSSNSKYSHFEWFKIQYSKNANFQNSCFGSVLEHGKITQQFNSFNFVDRCLLYQLEKMCSEVLKTCWKFLRLIFTSFFKFVVWLKPLVIQIIFWVFSLWWINSVTIKLQQSLIKGSTMLNRRTHTGWNDHISFGFSNP